MMASRFEGLRIAERAKNPPQPASQIRPVAGPAGPEIVAVDQTHLVVGDGALPRRRFAALLVLASGFVPLIFWAAAILRERGRVEAQLLRFIDAQVASLGPEYIENLIASGDRTLPMVWPNRSLSIAEYLRYDIVLTPGGWQATLPIAILAGLFLLGGIAGATILWQSGGVRLVFDRERQAAGALVGKDVFIARWADLHYVNRSWEFGWILFDRAGRERLIPVRTGATSLGVLPATAGDAHAARVAAFMRQGPSAIESTPKGTVLIPDSLKTEFSRIGPQGEV